MTGGQEAITGVVNMPEDDEIAVEALVKHLYGYSYPLVILSETVDLTDTVVSSFIIQHVQVYAIGEKYQEPTLKDQAQAAFQEALQTDDSIVIQDLAIIVDLVYTSTVEKDRGLRDIVLKFVLDRKANLTSDAVKEEETKELFPRCPTLEFELYAKRQTSTPLTSAKTSKKSVMKWRCTYCETTYSRTSYQKPTYCASCGGLGTYTESA